MDRDLFWQHAENNISETTLLAAFRKASFWSVSDQPACYSVNSNHFVLLFFKKCSCLKVNGTPGHLLMAWPSLQAALAQLFQESLRLIRGAEAPLEMPSLKEPAYTCSPAFLQGGWAPHVSHKLQGTAAWLTPQPAQVSLVSAGISPLPQHLIQLNLSQISRHPSPGAKRKSSTVAVPKDISFGGETYVVWKS